VICQKAEIWLLRESSSDTFLEVNRQRESHPRIPSGLGFEDAEHHSHRLASMRLRRKEALWSTC
jgi:hypothetical protein